MSCLRHKGDAPGFVSAGAFISFARYLLQQFLSMTFYFAAESGVSREPNA